MKTSMEAVFLAALSTSGQEFVSLVVQHQSRGDKVIVKSILGRCSDQSGAQICEAIAETTRLGLEEYRNVLERQQQGAEEGEAGGPREGNGEGKASPAPPYPSARMTRAQGRKRGAADSSSENETASSEREAADRGKRSSAELGRALKAIHGCAFLAQVALSDGMRSVMHPAWLFPAVLNLHDSLVLLEGDSALQESISGLCELWWRQDWDGKESLIVQSLPFLLSKALSYGRKKDVQRLYGMRSALLLFDFFDDSIEDMKHLLIRTVITPAFLRTQTGRRFISFLFGLDPQLVKELIVIVRSQVPYGRKSILEAYGEILYQAWKSADGACRREIELTCIQGLYEAALYASGKGLGASVRIMLEGISAQKAKDGVDAMLFWLLEPLLFRALQAANSNVRQNALLVLADVFPLQDPSAGREEKEAVLEKQFSLMEKLLADPCPDVRRVAVKVVCRILRLFWEVIPAATTVNLLNSVVDDMAEDSTSVAVRLAALKGVSYLLENAQSHPALKKMLPRLGPLLTDAALAVRVAAADLLLVVKGIRDIPFYDVVPIESLLSCLAADHPPVARRLTRLLLPSYFRPSVPVSEACRRCVALLKRSPQAGAQFCTWLLLEGASRESLLELVRVLAAFARAEELPHVRSGAFLALSGLSQSLMALPECRSVVREILTAHELASLMGRAPDAQARAHVLRIASHLPGEDVSELVQYCREVATKPSLSPIDAAEVSAVHTLLLGWGDIDALLQSLLDICPDQLADEVRLRGGAGESAPQFREGEDFQGEFVAASGAALQVEILLAEDDMRSAILKSDRVPQLLRVLRGLSQTAVKLAGERSPALAGTCHPSSPVLAYAKLHIHIALVAAGVIFEQTEAGVASLSEPRQSAAESSVEKLSDIETAWKELLEWMRELLAKTTNRDNVQFVSASPPKTKLSRSGHAKKTRGMKKDKTKCTVPAAVADSDDDLIVNFLSTIVPVIADSLTLGLINDPSVREIGDSLVNDTARWLHPAFSPEVDVGVGGSSLLNALRAHGLNGIPRRQKADP